MENIGYIEGKVRDIYTESYKRFTGEEDDGIVSSVVDWHMIARQMIFFMGGEYRGYLDKDISEDIFGIKGIRIRPGDGWGYISRWVIESTFIRGKLEVDIVEDIINKYFRNAESNRRDIGEGLYVFRDDFKSLISNERDKKVKGIMEGLYEEYSVGWRFNGEDEDLGPVNGPLVLQEMIKANYIYNLAILSRYIEIKKNRDIVERLGINRINRNGI
jgi:hypothetical protein